MFSYGDPMFDILPGIVSLVFLVPTVAVGSRRLHDIGKSGWWQLLFFVPVIGWIILIVWFATKTKADTHEFNQNSTVPKWIKFFLFPALAAVLACLVIIGTLVTTGSVPDTKVVAGTELSSGAKSELVEHQIINEEDRVLFYYSTDLFSFANEGQLITETTVISYIRNEDGNIDIWKMDFDGIDRVEQIQDGDFLTDSIYRIYGNSKSELEWMDIWLSTEENGDETFVNFIKERLR